MRALTLGTGVPALIWIVLLVFGAHNAFTSEAAPMNDPSVSGLQIVSEPKFWAFQRFLKRFRRKRDAADTTKGLKTGTIWISSGKDCLTGLEPPSAESMAESPQVIKFNRKMKRREKKKYEQEKNEEAKKYSKNCKNQKCYFNVLRQSFICRSSWLRPSGLLIAILAVMVVLPK